MPFSGKCFKWMVPCLIYFDCLSHIFWEAFFSKICDMTDFGDLSWKDDIISILSTVPRIKANLLQENESTLTINSTTIYIKICENKLIDFKITKDGILYGI